MPTVAPASVLVVIDGAAGTVRVTEELLVESATEVAVTVMVWDEAVAAGAVYVVEVVVDPPSVPPPLTVHVTPAEFLSLVTLAVTVTESVPSTVLDDAEAETLIGFELLEPELPQLDSPIAATKTHNNERNLFADTRFSF